MRPGGQRVGSGRATLEIIQYTEQLAGMPTAVNRPGFRHIAFTVDDVTDALARIHAAGGGAVGEIVTVEQPSRGQMTAVYAIDPEGSVIELLRWD